MTSKYNIEYLMQKVCCYLSTVFQYCMLMRQFVTDSQKLHCSLACDDECSAAKEPVQKSSGNVSSRVARPRHAAVAQSKLSLVRRPEHKPGADYITELHAVLLSHLVDVLLLQHMQCCVIEVINFFQVCLKSR